LFFVFSAHPAMPESDHIVDIALREEQAVGCPCPGTGYLGHRPCCSDRERLRVSLANHRESRDRDEYSFLPSSIFSGVCELSKSIASRVAASETPTCLRDRTCPAQLTALRNRRRLTNLLWCLSRGTQLLGPSASSRMAEANHMASGLT
jgi:hypothetical protein